MYGFLLTPRWLGYAALSVAMAAVMVLLGLWQFDRYEQRSAVNARIGAAAGAEPVDVGRLVSVGATPPTSANWARVSATGRYDPAHEVLARNRTVRGAVGYEVLTPLIREDGSAVLVDRGWVPAGPGGASQPPEVPPAPTGTVTVVGRVHPPESGAGRVERVIGRPSVRRIAPAQIAGSMPYPLLGAYLTLERQDPPADPGFVAIEPDRPNALQNAGYVLQWWLMAAMTLFGFGYLARREARQDPRWIARTESIVSASSARLSSR